MNLYVLDTNVFTLYSHGHERVGVRIEQHRGNSRLAAVTVEESLKGWLAQIRRARAPVDIDFAYHTFIQAVTLTASFSILPYTVAAIARYESLKKLKLNVGGNDLRIAAIALEHNATVVTANLRDITRVPELKAEDWTQ